MSQKAISVIDMLMQPSDTLKEFHEWLKQLNEKSTAPPTVCTHFKTVLESVIQRNTNNNSLNLANKRSEMALKALECLVDHKKLIHNYNDLLDIMTSVLDKDYMEKLSKLFEGTSAEHTLKIIRVLVQLLDHQFRANLDIANPLLRVLETGFKHTSQSVRSMTYVVWTSVVENFAQDKAYLLKPKKMALLLMPFTNKCRSFKEENVCKSKAVSWAKMITLIGPELSKFEMKIVLPFLKFCFGARHLPEQFEDEHQSSSDWRQKLTKFMDKKAECEHEFNSLKQIGMELLLAILLDKWPGKTDSSFCKKFTYINPAETNFETKPNASFAWLCYLKFYFELYLESKGSFPVSDSSLMLESWQHICLEFGMNFSQVDKCVEEDDDTIELVEFFLAKTIEHIVCFHQTKSANDNKYMMSLIRNIGVVLIREYNKKLSTNQIYYPEFRENIIKVIGIAGNLTSVVNDKDTDAFLADHRLILDLMDCEESLIDVDTWMTLANKLRDHLKHLKLKTNEITIKEQNLDVIKRHVIFPFKQAKYFKIKDTDCKQIINTCSAIATNLMTLVKQSRVKLIDDRVSVELQDPNNWMIGLFTGLKSSLKSDLTSFWSSFNHNHNHLTSNLAVNIEETLKILQLNSQFVLNILAHLDMDSLNPKIAVSASSVSDEGSNSGDSNDSILPSQSMRRKTESVVEATESELIGKRMMDLMTFLADMTKLFFYFIQSQPKLSHFVNKNSLDENTETSTPGKTKKFEFVDKPSSVTDSPGQGSSSEGRQVIQMFASICESISLLFTRIKPCSLLNECLLTLAPTIELLTELYVLSKSSQQVLDMSHHSSLNPHFRFNKLQISICTLQSTRRSNEQFDSMSIQLATYIQSLPETMLRHQFDSSLLEKLEPVFYSFLSSPTKLALKQKILQAWNQTFGKSTVSALTYSKRLEKLFVELREEMISNKSGKSASSDGRFSGIGFVALSLPGLKPIDSASLATESSSTFLPSVTTPAKSARSESEKENNPECMNSISMSCSPQQNMSCDDGFNFMSPVANASPFQKKTGSSHKKKVISKEYSNDSCSVPIAHFMPSKSASVAAVASPAQIGQVTFSPINKNLKTPDSGNSNQPNNKQTPQSASSKRKLELNFQVPIDQLPDKEFVQIVNNTSTASSRKSTGSIKTRTPLTEHQKEARRNRSFIPSVVQSVTAEFDYSNLDSQMSMMDDDTNTQSMMMPPPASTAPRVSLDRTASSQLACFQSQTPELKSSTMDKNISVITLNSTANQSIDMSDENASDVMILDHQPSSQAQNQPNSDPSLIDLITDDEESSSSRQQSSAPSEQAAIKTEKPTDHVVSSDVNTNPTIKFQSKINPKKQIELFKVAESIEERVNPVEMQKDNSDEECDGAKRRRSARLKSSDSEDITENIESIDDEIVTNKKLNKIKLKSTLIKKSKRLLAISKPKPSRPSSKISLVKLGKVPKVTGSKRELRNRIQSIIKKAQPAESSVAQSEKSDENQPPPPKMTRRMRRNEQRMLLLRELNKEFIGEEKTEQQEVKQVIEDKKVVDDSCNEEDDDQPLSQLVAKRQKQAQEAIVESKTEEKPQQETVPDAHIVEKVAQVEEKENKPEKMVEELPIETNSTTESVSTVSEQPVQQAVSQSPPRKSSIELTLKKNNESSPSTPQLTAGTAKNGSQLSRLAIREFALNNSAPTIGSKSSLTTDDIMHKLNNTPTTSILKKKLKASVMDSPTSVSFIHRLDQAKRLEDSRCLSNCSLNSSFSSMSSLVKRRVSFCEAVKVEEIEIPGNKVLKPTSMLLNASAAAAAAAAASAAAAAATNSASNSNPRLNRYMNRTRLFQNNNKTINAAPVTNSNLSPPDSTTANNTKSNITVGLLNTSTDKSSNSSLNVDTTTSISPSSAVSPQSSSCTSSLSITSPTSVVNTSMKLPTSNLSGFLQMKNSRLSDSSSAVASLLQQNSPTSNNNNTAYFTACNSLNAMQGSPVANNVSQPPQSSSLNGSPAASIINYLSNNKLNFLSQRSSRLQMLQQHKQQQSREERNITIKPIDYGDEMKEKEVPVNKSDNTTKSIEEDVLDLESTDNQSTKSADVSLNSSLVSMDVDQVTLNTSEHVSQESVAETTCDSTKKLTISDLFESISSMQAACGQANECLSQLGDELDLRGLAKVNMRLDEVHEAIFQLKKMVRARAEQQD